MRKKDSVILLVGSSDTCPDIRYVTGLQVNDPVVLLLRGRKRWLVVPGLEQGRAARVARGVTVTTPRGLGLRGETRRKQGGWALGLLRKLGIKSVCVAGTFPFGVARYLERRGIVVRACGKPLFPQRAVKGKVELARIREAQRAAVAAMCCAVKLIGEARIDAGGVLRAGGRALESAAVRAAINKSLLERGCFCRDAIVACGAQAADPHEVGEGPLRAGESIVIDIFPQHLGHGYWGDLTRTVVRGRASERLRSMYRAVRAAQRAALATVRPGVKAKSVHERAAATLRERGFKTELRDGRPVGFFHGTGHGLGLEVHEAPAVSTAEGRLRSGNVITVEPGLYYPEAGGVRIEDTVVVTPSGWRYVAPCERRLEIDGDAADARSES